MARLKAIFDDIHNTEIEKTRYFANKINEALVLTEGLDGRFTLSDIEYIIFLEAIHLDDKTKALEFVNSIKYEFINEGFINNAVTKAANWVSNGVKKIIQKVKDWFDGPIKSAFDKFYNTIKQPALELKKTAIQESEDPAVTTTVKKNNKIINMLSNIVTMMPKFGNTGAMSQHLKKYTTEKVKGVLILNVGGDKDTATFPLLTYNKSAHYIYLNLSSEVIQDTKDMGFIYELIENIKVSGLFETGITDITLNGTAITLTVNEVPTTIKVGDMVSIPIDAKLKSPLKKTSIGSSEDFLKQSASVTPEEVEQNNPDATVEVPAKQWIGNAINKSGIKNIDKGLVQSLGIDINSLWNNFFKFANKNQNDIVDMLLQMNGNGNHVPMTNNEFIAFSTTLSTLLGYLWNNVSKNKIDSQIYDKDKFKDFLAKAYGAAVELNKTINATVINANNNVTPTNVNLEELRKKITILSDKQIEQLKKVIGMTK